MSTFGVTSQGFVPKIYTDIVADLEAAFRAAFGQSIDTSPASVYGQIIGIIAERYADLWDAAQSVSASFDPDEAVGQALDYLAALTGTERKTATHSIVPCVLIGTDGTVVADQSVATVTGTSTRWLSQGASTIATVSAWAITTTYATGALVVHDTGKLYYATEGGISAGSGGPTGTSAAITDGTVTWMYIATAPAAVVVNFQAEDSGVIVALEGALITIGTPTSGWTSVVNPIDATLGAPVNSDSTLRARRDDELAQNGSGSVEAIRAKVLQLTGVDVCSVFENVTDATDVNSLPPHSIEVLVGTSAGFVEADLLQVIWANKPAGIAMHGDISGSIIDSQGNSQTIKYSTPTEKDVYVILNLSVDPTVWSDSTGSGDVVDAMLLYGAAVYVMGKDVVERPLTAQAFKVAGTLDGTSFVGFSPSPGASTTLSIGAREFAKLDSSRITVNVTDGTP